MNIQNKNEINNYLKLKANYYRKETIRIHGLSPGSRLASSLSIVEILTCLYCGDILRYDPECPDWEERDRLIISKGHGGITLYPILADLGFISHEDIETINQKNARIGDILDASTPGVETINGSLGHGIGIATGMALGLNKKMIPASAIVIMGDGELNEGSVWEAIMFAGHHQLNNLFLILDCNKISMLDYCRNTIDLEPLEEKLKLFKWDCERVHGHEIDQLYPVLQSINEKNGSKPKAIIADTIKGKGVKELENNPMCHILTLSQNEVKTYL